MASRAAVPSLVLEAFGLSGAPVVVAGGQGSSVQVGHAVLKPVDDPVEATWGAEVLSRLPEDGYRLARPLRARDGAWVAHGWVATSLVEGSARPSGRWAELLRAARAFHGALRGEGRPAFLADRTHRWALADRVAWGDATARPTEAVAPLLGELTGLLRPVSNGPEQLVHGDLSGNVLFAPGLPPAIIDFSPYWRSPAYAEAIVAADSLLWFGAADEVLDLVSSGPESAQLVLRALIFRLVDLNERAQVEVTVLDELPLFRDALATLQGSRGHSCR